jgi:hypothetical protein
MKSTLDSEFPAADERLVGWEIERRNTPARTSYGSVFDMCLVLSVVFCVLQLAVQLPRARMMLHQKSARKPLAAAGPQSKELP